MLGVGRGRSRTLSVAAPTRGSVVGCDPAKPVVEFARDRVRDARLTFVVAGVGDLPRRTGGYGSVTSLLALNFFPRPEAAIQEMRSLAAPQRTVSACVWDYSERMEFLRYFWDAAMKLDPTAQALDEGKRFPLCHPDELTRLFRFGGLADIRCDALETPTIFANFRDYWEPFLGGTGPAPSYIASLDAERREMLSRTLEESLPQEPDGTIALTAGAWAIRGTVI
jgi:hypothetical protein